MSEERNLEYLKVFWKSPDIEDAKHNKIIVGMNWDESINSHLPKILDSEINKFDRVLEIGCGIGRILKPLSFKFKEVYGVDISDSMVELSKDYIKEDNIEIIQNDGYSLPFDGDYFDYVFSLLVFQHLGSREMMENYVRESNRVLSSGGLFKFQAHRVSGLYTYNPKVDNYGFFGIGVHESYINAILNIAGFTNIDIRGDGKWLWSKAQKA